MTRKQGKVEITTKNHHFYSKCEGCGNLRKHSKMVWFMGHFLCGLCKRRSNFPLVGYKNKVAWELEKKIEKKDRKVPYITWTEKQILWKFYDSKGLSDRDKRTRIHSLQRRVRANHWSASPGGTS